MGVEATATCNLCESLCGLRVEVDGARVVRVRGDPDDPLSRGHVCPKAIGLKALLEDPDRLRTPVIRDGTGWRTAGWEEALEAAIAPLRAIRRSHGPDAVALYVGNPVVHSLHGTLAAGLLSVVLGTHNRFDPNSQDGNPRLFACMQVYGDALAMPVPDVDRTDLLVVLGANPAASNGSMMGLGDPKARLKGIVARGGRVVLVDPRRTETAAWATEHHFIRPGGDAALLLALLHVLLAREVDPAIAARTTGLEALREVAAGFSPERVGPAVGFDPAALRSLAADLARTPRACVYARVGVCQGAFGPLACWLVEAINVVTGHLDRPGGAMFPTAAADVAPIGRLLVGNRWGRWRSRVRGLPEVLGSLPSAVLSEEIETGGPGRIHALVCLAGNPVLSTPNGPRLARALASLQHLVAVDYYLNETTRLAKVVLPPRHVFETGQFDLLLSRLTVRNAAKYAPPILRTGDDTRDDWEIATEIALRLRVPGALRGPLRALARGLPERVVGALLRLGPYRLRLDALRAAPHGVDLGPLQPSGGRPIRTRDRKIHLAPEPFLADVPRLSDWVDQAVDGLVLIGRRHLRSDNSWLHNLRPLAKGPDRATLLVHPDDAARHGLSDGGRARIRSRVGAVEAPVEVTDAMMPGVVSLPHGYGHAAAKDTLRVAGALPGPSANALTDEARVEPILGTSVLNGVPVTVERIDA